MRVLIPWPRDSDLQMQLPTWINWPVHLRNNTWLPSSLFLLHSSSYGYWVGRRHRRGGRWRCTLEPGGQQHAALRRSLH